MKPSPPLLSPAQVVVTARKEEAGTDQTDSAATQAQGGLAQFPETLVDYLKRNHLTGADVWPRQSGCLLNSRGKALLQCMTAGTAEEAPLAVTPSLASEARGYWEIPPPPAPCRARMRRTRLAHRQRLKQTLWHLQRELSELMYWMDVGIL
ncbi:E4 [Equus caballus papillomavirus 5]|uniref:E4 n=1 Tax=Equus caballus papillomavirus 5 TaxID=1235429 RepID=K9M8U7_9PAPI|nr:E4 [Equus caballus papillomavirus 5]AFS89113.1 E4 [Equus caballus papillomavirus 5]